MQIDARVNRDRAKSIVGVALFHAAIGYALIHGLGFVPVAVAEEPLTIFDVAPEPPPPPVAEPDKPAPAPKKPEPKDPEGAASPKNLRDTPSPIVAPPPAIVLPVISPVIAAPVAADGNRESAGAADVPGPGTGSGGQGTGRGSGSAGDGMGGGGGGGTGGDDIPSRLIRGEIRDSDYPRAAVVAGSSGTVHLRFTVTPKGRVAGCTITRTSGHPSLDEVTCRLITRRFRYRPARDASGRAVSDTVQGEHLWQVGPEPPVTEIEPTIWE